jgi:hypothetical protein
MNSAYTIEYKKHAKHSRAAAAAVQGQGKLSGFYPHQTMKTYLNNILQPQLPLDRLPVSPP